MKNKSDKSCYKSKFNKNQVLKMREMAEEGYAISYIARKFDCCANSIVHRVFDVITPRYIPKEKQKLYLKNSKLHITDVKRIRKLGVEGVDAVAIGKIYGISQTTALAIINGKTFRWIPGNTLSGYINPISYDPMLKTDKIRGPKKGSKKKVKNRVLLKYAEKYKISLSTVCRRVSKGYLKLKSEELI